MLSMLTFAGIGSRLADAPDDLDPGFLTLIARIVRSIREARGSVQDEKVAAFIESNGGQMSDDLERRIGSGVMTGRF